MPSKYSPLESYFKSLPTGECEVRIVEEYVKFKSWSAWIIKESYIKRGQLEGCTKYYFVAQKALAHQRMERAKKSITSITVRKLWNYNATACFTTYLASNTNSSSVLHRKKKISKRVGSLETIACYRNWHVFPSTKYRWVPKMQVNDNKV